MFKKVGCNKYLTRHSASYTRRLKTTKNGGSTQECMGILRCFSSGFTENFAKKDIKEAAKLFIIIYFMNFGKKMVYLSKKQSVVFSKVAMLTS